MTALSVSQIAERYAVTVPTVLGWIRSGELKPIDVSRRPGSRRPTWRVTPEALAAFEAMRTAATPPPKTRRRKQAADVINFY